MRYKLSCVNPLSKRMDVSLTVDKELGGALSISLAKWRPGRYEYGSFAGYIYSLQASIPDGSPIVVTKTSTHQWVIDSPYIGCINIKYQVYANRLDAGGTYIAEDFWLVNPINSLLSIDECVDQEIHVELALPEQFKVSTSLKNDRGTWKASSFDELLDCPILVSRNLEKLEFEVGNKPFVLAIHGSHQLDKDKLINDFKKYTLAQNQVMPWENAEVYEYQLMFFRFKIYHGVEHMNGTTIVLGSTDDDQFYENLMGISSHELFHYWNIKRIRPKQLSPYKFSQENYFDTGFVAEGFTTYYGDLFLVRGGVFDEAWYLSEVNRLLKRHFENYGRHSSSLTDSSQDLWVDGYRNEAPHRKVSIYVKGALVALMLDLTIRKASNGQKSLDNVMRSLWIRFGAGPEGYLSQDVKQIVEKTGGIDLSVFFEYYIQGVEPIEKALTDLLNWVGLKLEAAYPEDKLMSFLGVRVGLNDGSFNVISTVPESLGESHLTAGDKILAINGETDKPPFQRIKTGLNSFEIERLGSIIEISVELHTKSYFSHLVVSIDSNGSADAHQRRTDWLNPLSPF